MNKGLSSRQFVIIALIIMLSGVAIFSHDYFLKKRAAAIDNINVAFEDGDSPEVVEPVETTDSIESEQINSATLDNTEINVATLDNGNDSNISSNNETVVVSNPTNNTIKKKKNKNNYAGRIKIPKIGLNKGFVEAPTDRKGIEACVNQNVCSYSGSNNYPSSDPSHLILGAHNGSGWNAFFTRIDKLKIGSYAYIEYKNKRYKYKLVNIYKDGKGDLAIKFRSNGATRQLSLFTCARPNYNRYYLVLNYKLVAEENM